MDNRNRVQHGRAFRIMIVVAALILAAPLTRGVAALIDNALANRNVTLCVESGGRRITDRPISEGLARIIAQQCADELRARGVIQRFRNANGWVAEQIAATVGELLDPISLGIWVILSFALALAGRRFFRVASTSETIPPIG